MGKFWQYQQLRFQSPGSSPGPPEAQMSNLETADSQLGSSIHGQDAERKIRQEQNV